MKQTICLLIVLCMTSRVLQAQELVQKKYIIYNTRIQDSTGHFHKGFIATIDDTAVFMSESKFALTFEHLDLTHLQKFGYADISTLSLRGSGKIGRGALIGGITGFLVGAIGGVISVQGTAPKGSIGYAPQPTPGEAALIVGVAGAGLGSLIGMICARSWKTFKIHGKKTNLDNMRETMISRLY
jgi:hypothetical protein